jgi:hypothetical protein
LYLYQDLVVSGSKGIFEAHGRYEREGTELTLTSDLIHLLRAESRMDASIGANESVDNSSQGSFKGRRSNISVSIPKKNIQKLPNIDNRI